MRMSRSRLHERMNKGRRKGTHERGEGDNMSTDAPRARARASMQRRKKVHDNRELSAPHAGWISSMPPQAVGRILGMHLYGGPPPCLPVHSPTHLCASLPHPHTNSCASPLIFPTHLWHSSSLLATKVQAAAIFCMGGREGRAHGKSTGEWSTHEHAWISRH